MSNGLKQMKMIMHVWRLPNDVALVFKIEVEGELERVLYPGVPK